MTKVKKGFTLIELMVVMAIIAVLAVLMIGAIQLARSTATETSHRSNAKTIQTALEANYAKAKVYCGNTGGPTCAASDLTSASNTLKVSLSTASSNCPAGEAGGGRITTLTATSYVIVPANAGCTAFTDVSDMLSVGVSPAPAVLPAWVPAS